MPIYQYRCGECGHQLEALQKMSDPKLVDCPACKAPALKKQVTAAAFKLKGTGWYETDFKNSGAKPKPSEPGSGSESSGSESPKSETSVKDSANQGSGTASDNSVATESSKTTASPKQPASAS